MVTRETAHAQDDAPGSDERPKKGDLLVFADGDHASAVIKPEDLPLGGPPVMAWPMDPATKVIRNGSRLNELLVVRFDPADLDDDDPSARRRRNPRLFSRVHACRMRRHRLGEGNRGRQQRLQMSLS